MPCAAPRHFCLAAYCAATGARTARFGAWPWNFGFNPVPTADCTSLEQSMTWTSAVPKGISGLNTTTKLSANLLYRCPGTMPVVGAAYNSTPILTFDVNSTTGTYSTSTVAGTLVNYPDGREVSSGLRPSTCSSRCGVCARKCHCGRVIGEAQVATSSHSCRGGSHFQVLIAMTSLC
jgi:hypothetical protein